MYWQVEQDTGTILSYQKGAEEDERNEVGVGKGAATFRSRVPRGWVAFLTTQTGQHDIMPSLTRSTPAYRETHKEWAHTLLTDKNMSEAPMVCDFGKRQNWIMDVNPVFF